MTFCFVDLFLIVLTACYGNEAKAFESGDNCGAENSGESGDGSCLNHAHNCEEAYRANDAAYDLERENKILESLGVNTLGKGGDEGHDSLFSGSCNVSLSDGVRAALCVSSCIGIRIVSVHNCLLNGVFLFWNWILLK